jgi:signal transduction histidine kinase
MQRVMPDRVRRHSDAAVAAGLVSLLLVQVWVLSVPLRDKVFTTGLALVLFIPLARRTRAPLLLLTTFAVTAVAGSWLPKRVTDVEAFGLIALLVVYNGGAHTRGRKLLATACISAAMAVFTLFADPDGPSLSGFIFFAMLFGAPCLAGYVVQRRRLGELRMRQERDAATAAIVEERARIARELHDVVAHAISVIVLQSRGGRRLLDDEPEETRGALDVIETTAQHALVEMRRLVGLLRADDALLLLSPQPTLAQLDQLVEQVRSAGMPVTVSVDGRPVPLPAGVDLSAYRIVQEALTNALKHAGPAHAQVQLRYGESGLEVEVSDDGDGSTNGDGGGHGLAGIRERIAVYGGELHVGPRLGRGYSLRAWLPYRRAP